MKIMVTSLKRSQACTATVHTPKPCRRPPMTHAFTGDSWTPTGKFPVGSVFLSSGSWCTRFCCAFQESISQSYVSSGISIVGLMANSSSRTYALPTPRACPCNRPLLICTSKGEAQTQFWGVPGSWCAQGLFEPSKRPWQEQGLMLNANSPLLLSCWCFSFALGCGVSTHRRSIAYCLTGFFLTLDVGYLFMVAPVKRRFQIGKGVCQGCILSPCLCNLYAEYIMRNAVLDEAQAGIKIGGRNINNLRYADDTTLMAESEELKRLLMKVKKESEKVGLKLNIHKTEIVASGPITSW